MSDRDEEEVCVCVCVCEVMVFFGEGGLVSWMGS